MEAMNAETDASHPFITRRPSETHVAEATFEPPMDIFQRENLAFFPLRVSLSSHLASHPRLSETT